MWVKLERGGGKRWRSFIIIFFSSLPLHVCVTVVQNCHYHVDLVEVLCEPACSFLNIFIFDSVRRSTTLFIILLSLSVCILLDSNITKTEGGSGSILEINRQHSCGIFLTPLANDGIRT